jgi:hypothetical protein
MWQTLVVVGAGVLGLYLYWHFAPVLFKKMEAQFVKDLIWSFRFVAREIVKAKTKLIAAGIVTDEELVKLLQQLNAILKKLQQ